MLIEVKPGIVLTSLMKISLEVGTGEKIHPRHPAQRQGLESRDRKLANAARGGGRQIGWNTNVGAVGINIFRVVAVKAVSLLDDDLAGNRRGGIVIAEHGAFELASFAGGLKQDFTIVLESVGERWARACAAPVTRVMPIEEPSALGLTKSG